jgi:flagellar biosynthetic protein FliP
MTGVALLVFGALCLVLAVIALGVRLARRTGAGPAQELPMRVIGRVSVGPRQGLAAVRVGEKVLVVSVGDGGVREICELDDEVSDLVPVENEHAGMAGLPGVTRLPGGAALRRVLRAVGATALVVAMGLGALALAPDPALAQAAGTVAETQSQDGMAALSEALPDMQLAVGGDGDGLQLSGTVGTVLVIGLLTLLPTLLLLMTSFTRILVVLHFLRQALGTQTAPPAQLIAALALLLTAFVMGPTLSRVNDVALEPWMAGEIDEAAMMKQAAVPFRDFMVSQVRESDLATFLDMSNAPAPETVDDIPLTTLVSAFAISELRTAFQIGFVLFLPFLIIDLVVAAVLMSLGMFMLPPVMVSLPFKLLLFVLVDGWALVVHNVVASFA